MDAQATLYIEALRTVPLFAELSPEHAAHLARSAQEADVPAGSVIVREGDPGENFFLVLSGTARVERGGQVVSRLSANQFVGEMSLLDGKPRAASVVMESDGTVLTISKEAFRSLMGTDEFRDTLFGLLCERIRALQAPRLDAQQPEAHVATLDGLYAYGELYDAIDSCDALLQALHRLRRHGLIDEAEANGNDSVIGGVRASLENRTSTRTAD